MPNHTTSPKSLLASSISDSRFSLNPNLELIKHDKANLDIFWLRDESLEDSANLPSPDVIAREITENLESALEQFTSIYQELEE